MDRFIIIKGKAGLGNRMLAAMTGVVYAQLSGRRAVIDWRDYTYSNDGSNAFPRLFSPSLPCIADRAPDTESVLPELWRGNLHSSANDLLDELDADKHSSPTIYRKYSADLTRLDHPQQALVMWCFTHQLGALRPLLRAAGHPYAPLSADAMVRDLLATIFVPAAPVAARVAAFRASRFEPRMIAVHVRFMDRRSRIEDFFKGIDRAKEAMPDAGIFLATDNREAEGRIRARYGPVVTTEKWYPTTGVSMHQNAECPDRFANAVEALIDMRLLAACDQIVFPGSSTFSWLASLSSSIPAANAIDVESANIRLRVKKLVRSWLVA